MGSDFNHETGDMRLWEYIDGTGKPEERAAIEKLMDSDPVWQMKYKELLDVQQWMHGSELEEPSMRFTKNVMDDIAKLKITPAAKIYINKNVIRGISICFIVLIGAFLLYGIAQTDWTSSEGTFLSDPVAFGFDKVSYSKFFNNTYLNIFLMINVVLGLFLLDRYLSARKEKYKKC